MLAMLAGVHGISLERILHDQLHDSPFHLNAFWSSVENSTSKVDVAPTQVASMPLLVADVIPISRTCDIYL